MILRAKPLARAFFFLAAAALLIAGLQCAGPLMPGRGFTAEHDQPVLPILLETRNFPSGDPARSRLDISVQVPFTFPVFVSKPGDDSLGYTGRAEISVEIFTSPAKSPAARELTREEVRVGRPPAPGDRRRMEKLFSWDLPPGTYSVLLEVRDLESNRRFADTRPAVILRDFTKDAPVISDILFLADTDAGGWSAPVPSAISGDIPVGRDAGGYLECAIPPPADSLRASYNVFRPGSGPKDRTMVVHDTIPDFSGTRFIGIRHGQEGDAYRLVDTSAADRRSAWFRLRTRALSQGVYDLEVTARSGSIVRTSVRHFRVRWPDMPRSLRSMAVAIDALAYVATEDEIRKIKSADREQQAGLIEEYWKRKDSTSSSPVNPLMAEYYTRVDYAMTAFATFRETNGMKSDRGKTYILYGPPTSVNRDLKPGAAPQEVWEYVHLHKRFTFIDESRQGDYKLGSVADIP